MKTPLSFVNSSRLNSISFSPFFYDKKKEKFSMFSSNFDGEYFSEEKFINLFSNCYMGENMPTKRSALLLRLRDEDREMVRQLAKYYDIAEADVIKILIHEYMKNHNIGVTSS